MSITLRIFILIGIIFYFVLIFHFLRKKELALKYTLLWMAAGVIMLFFDLFPTLLTFMVHLFGIELPVNVIFAICIFFLIILLMYITSIVSKQTERIRTLTQYTATLEKRIRQLEEQNKQAGDKYESFYRLPVERIE